MTFRARLAVALALTVVLTAAVHSAFACAVTTHGARVSAHRCHDGGPTIPPGDAVPACCRQPATTATTQKPARAGEERPVPQPPHAAAAVIAFAHFGGGSAIRLVTAPPLP